MIMSYEILLEAEQARGVTATLVTDIFIQQFTQTIADPFVLTRYKEHENNSPMPSPS
jgi:hypothetical protein